MSRDVHLIRPTDTVEAAAKVMASHDTGFLPVADFDSDRLVGMVTDRDLVTRAVAAGKAPGSVLVRDVMTGEVLYCFEDEPVDHIAANMAEQRVRRLPVMSRDKRLVGVITMGDVASVNPQAAGQAMEGVASDAGGAHSQRASDNALGGGGPML